MGPVCIPGFAVERGSAPVGIRVQVLSFERSLGILGPVLFLSCIYLVFFLDSDYNGALDVF